MRNFRLIFALFSMILFCSCNNDGGKAIMDKGIFFAGKLDDVVLKNERQALVDLADYQGVPALYAIGLLENVDGPFIIWEGELHACQLDGQTLNCETSQTGACQFAYIYQPLWQEEALPDEVNSLPTLERFLLSNKKKWGFEAHQAFAIKMEGVFPVIQYHIPSHPPVSNVLADYRTTGMEGNLNGETVQLFGFFSNAHKGVFIHQGNLSNLFVYGQNSGITGQIRRLTIPAGQKIWIGR